MEEIKITEIPNDGSSLLSNNSRSNDIGRPVTSKLKWFWVSASVLAIFVGCIVGIYAFLSPTSAASQNPDSGEARVSVSGSLSSTMMSCSSGDISFTTTDGKSRKIEYYKPSSATASSAIIIVWHGLSASPSKIEDQVTMKGQADDNGWILVYPYGTGTWTSFNGAGCCDKKGPDDVQFTRELITYLETNECGNTNKVFSMGFSNGGFMGHRIGCEIGLRDGDKPWITGIVAHSGLHGQYTGSLPSWENYEGCADAQKIPILSFHGTDDPTVGYNGYNSNPFSSAKWFSFQDTMSIWKAVHECDLSKDYEETPTSTTSCIKNPTCNVVSCTITGLVHLWSGPEKSNSNDIDATATVVEFFKNLGA